MEIAISNVVREGPEQFRRIVGLRLIDGTEITSEEAIARMLFQNVIYRKPSGEKIRLIHRKVLKTELDG